MSLEIIDLTKNYGAQQVLQNINLKIGEGEIVALLGPNGAGKSTLMKSVVGAVKPDGGEIFFNGEKMADDEPEAKKSIGFLAENNPLYEDMYVREYLEFVADFRKIGTDKVSQIIDLVGLTPEKSKKITTLSKGYRQRVGLAQAILHDPGLLILDEPTNGLDPNQIIEIRNIIKNIGREKTVILSTHLMQEAEAICTRVILIHQGKILKDCAIEDFRDKFKNLEEAFSHYTS